MKGGRQVSDMNGSLQGVIAGSRQWIQPAWTRSAVEIWKEQQLPLKPPCRQRQGRSDPALKHRARDHGRTEAKGQYVQ